MVLVGIPTARTRKRIDARFLQIAFLGSLLLLGVVWRDFALRWSQVALAFAAGLLTQAVALHVLKLRNVGYLSACVSCLGISILVRADSLWVHPLVAALAIASKFVIRFRGKHIFNPANLAAIVAVTLLPGAWLSPGQWGNDLLLALWFVFLGVTVTGSARRFDISLAFLIAYALLLAARGLWLEMPIRVWAHPLQSGVLLLFAFFMISDPMTTPNHRFARIGYALGVAILAVCWQFLWFRSNALIWALFLLTPIVPILDWRWPAPPHAWRVPPSSA